MIMPKNVERIVVKGSHFIEQIGFHDESKSVYVKMIGGEWYGYQFKAKSFYEAMKAMLPNVSAKVLGSIYGGVLKNSKFAADIALIK